MALFEFKLPDIGEGVAEGEVVTWHVELGQVVAEDQEMVEVMTDKATVTIGAPKAGRIAQLNAKVGEKVPVGSVLVVIDTTTRRPLGPTEVSSPRAKQDEGPAATAVGDIRDSLPGTSFFASPSITARNGTPSVTARSGTPSATACNGTPSITACNGTGSYPRVTQLEVGGTPAFFAEKPLATPATRKLARDAGIDLRRVRPTGPGGRVTPGDVAAITDGGAGSGTHATSLRDVTGPRSAAESSALEERKPFVGLRRRIAERMRTATQTAAHFTFVEEVDVGALKTTIGRLRPAADQHGIKLNYLPFIVKAVTLALKKHPILNSTLDEAKNELVYRRYYHVGIATATEQGLMVPVLRDANRLSPLAIAREIQRISDGARAGTLTPKELGGSTFTITSLGKQGGLLATPVLNHPEVGILGVHRVKERPVVKDGQIVIGQVMLLSLSFDHRIIDGHIGAAFAYDVIAYLENPDLLLLELA